MVVVGGDIWLSCFYGSYISSNALGLLVDQYACLRICERTTAEHEMLTEGEGF